MKALVRDYVFGILFAALQIIEDNRVVQRLAEQGFRRPAQKPFVITLVGPMSRSWYTHIADQVTLLAEWDEKRGSYEYKYLYTGQQRAALYAKYPKGLTFRQTTTSWVKLPAQ